MSETNAPAVFPFAWLSPDVSPRRRRSWWAAALVVLVLAAYLPAIRGTFIWDDPRYVTENRLLRSAEGLRDIWVTSIAPRVLAADNTRVTPQYYPMTHTTFWVEYQLWGLNPLGYHAVNVLLHCVSALLLWGLLRRLGIPAAWLAAAIFALHPLQVESVAWVTERKNVLSLLFYLGAIWFYLRFARPGTADRDEGSPAGPHRAKLFYGLSLGLFLLALLSKTVASSMPVTMALILWWKNGKLSRRDLLPLLPYVVLGATLGLTTAWIERTHVGAVGPDWQLSLLQRFLVAGNSVWFYVGKLVWPASLCFSYPKWELSAANALLYVGPLAMAGLVAGLWRLRERIGRGPLTAVLIYLVTLAPAMGFFPVYPMRYSYVADHFQYMAGVALIVLLVGGLAGLLWPTAQGMPTAQATLTAQGMPTARAAWAAGGAYALGGLLALLLAGLTWKQAHLYSGVESFWRAELQTQDLYGAQETLWRDTLAKNGRSYLAAHSLGAELMRQAEALDQRLAVLRQRGEETAQTQLSIRQKRQEAEMLFARTVQLRPQHDWARLNWGQVLAQQGKTDQAFAKLQEAQAKAQEDLQHASGQNSVIARQTARRQLMLAHLYQADLLSARKELDLARKHYQAALELEPASGSLHYFLGDLCWKQGKAQEALDYLRRAIERRPNYAEAYFLQGQVLLSLHRDEEAFEAFSQALRLKPGHAPAHVEIGYLQGRLGRFTEAAASFGRALQLDPGNAAARQGLQLAERSLQTATPPVPWATTPSTPHPATRAVPSPMAP